MKAEIYKHIAYLFYAVAMADRKMEVVEKKAIVDYVEKYFDDLIDNKNSKDLIYAEMRSITGNNLSADESFEIFKKHYKLNSSVYSKYLKSRILEIASGIAQAHASVNKSELIMLNKLKMLLY